jgi:hypothetical protein
MILAYLAAGCNSPLTKEELIEISGTWYGHSSDFSKPSKPDSLFPVVSITILHNGKIEGYAGNAQLIDCFVEKNRGPIAKTIGVETDYKIEGFLSGRISPSDTTTVLLRNIAVPFNIVNDTLAGSLFIEKPWTYPFPILSKLRLSRKMTVTTEK